MPSDATEPDPYLQSLLGGVQFRLHRPTVAAPLPSIHTGVFFVVASWSGPATARLKALHRVLVQLGERAPELVVAYTDHIPFDAWKPLGATPGGWGETFWFRQGDIVARLAGARSGSADSTEAVMRRNTLAILDP